MCVVVRLVRCFNQRAGRLYFNITMPNFKFNTEELLLDFRRQFKSVHGLLTFEKGRTLNANFTKLMGAIQDDAEWDSIAQIAYLLSSAYHETAHDFEPRDEFGRGKGRLYGQHVQLTANTVAAYYGRGLVQLTWLANYARASLLCNVDFVTQPQRVKEWPYCYFVMADGMRKGWFTGKPLVEYINPTKTDFVNARRVINGTDKAELIAGFARMFEQLLTAHGEGE